MDSNLVKILALEFNKDPEVIERIIRSQFEFVMNTMEEGNFESVHLHKYGKFACKPGRLKQLKEYEERQLSRG